MDTDKHTVQKGHTCFHIPVLSGQSIVSFRWFLNLHPASGDKTEWKQFKSYAEVIGR